MSSTKNNSSKRKRSANWSSDETFKLISLWQDQYPKLRKASRRGPIYQSISDKLKDYEVDRSSTEVQNRIKSLESKFRHEKPKQTGSSPFKWPFFEVLNKFIGQSAVNAHDTVESLLEEDQSLGGQFSSDEAASNDTMGTNDVGDDQSNASPASKRRHIVVADSSDDDGSKEKERTEPDRQVKRRAGARRRSKSTFEIIREELIANGNSSNEFNRMLNETLSSLNPILQSMAQSMAALPNVISQPSFFQPQLFHHYPNQFQVPLNTSQQFQYANQTVPTTQSTWNVQSESHDYVG